MKLSTKIRLFSSLFMLVLILLVNTSIYYLFHNISVESELEQLSDQTNEIVRTINKNPDIAKSELLSAFLPVDGMIRVLDDGQEPHLLTKTKKREYRSLPFSYTTSETKSVISMDNNPDFITVSKPIIWKNGEVVSLQVSKQLVALNKTMQNLFFVLLIASVIMLIPTIVAGSFLSSFILRPIKALTSTMKENIQAGKWKKINGENKSKDELNEMKKTFNVMIEHLKTNYEKQEVFVSDASHELKTPISIVKSYAQLLKRRGRDNPELFKESMQAIDSEADRMQKLVEQMLLLAKNQEKDAMEKLNIVHLCKHIVEQFIGAYQRDIVFESNESSLYVNGSEGQLQQVVYILLDNALKYSTKQVKISVFQKNDHASINVQDYGAGIPKQEQKNIFDRFYRMDESRNRKSGGTGLGLAIAKTIVEAHGGGIKVISGDGEGSVFTIELPILKES